MARTSDNSPVGNTCPIIDSVKSFINDIEYSEDHDGRLTKYALDNLEEIRNANSTLRDFGNAQYALRETYENKCDELSDKISSLENDIQNLEDVIKKLENQIDELT